MHTTAMAAAGRTVLFTLCWVLCMSGFIIMCESVRLFKIKNKLLFRTTCHGMAQCELPAWQVSGLKRLLAIRLSCWILSVTPSLKWLWHRTGQQNHR